MANIASDVQRESIQNSETPVIPKSPAMPNLFAPILYTPRLRIRFWDTTTDVDKFALGLVNDPEVKALLGPRPEPITAELWAGMVRNAALDPELPNNNSQSGFKAYVMESRTTGERIGLLSLRQFVKIPDIGYLLVPKFWGQGYATEGAAELLRHATQDVGIKEIIAFVVNHENFGSLAVLKKIGMVQVPGPHFKDGKMPKEGEEEAKTLGGRKGFQLFKLKEMEDRGIWLESRDVKKSDVKEEST